MTSNVISFRQLNMHKAAAASAELNIALNDSLQIALVTEPYTAHNKVVSIPQGYKAFPSTPLETTPRAAVIFPNHLTITALTNLSTADCATVLLRANNAGLILCSLYMDLSLIHI